MSFLEGIKEISEAIEKKNNPFSYFEKAVNRIPESCRDAAIALFRDPEDAVNELGVIMTDELCGYAKELEEAEEAIDNPTTKYLTHEEIFAKARRLIDAKK